MGRYILGRVYNPKNSKVGIGFGSIGTLFAKTYSLLYSLLYSVEIDLSNQSQLCLVYEKLYSALFDKYHQSVFILIKRVYQQYQIGQLSSQCLIYRGYAVLHKYETMPPKQRYNK